MKILFALHAFFFVFALWFGSSYSATPRDPASAQVYQDPYRLMKI